MSYIQTILSNKNNEIYNPSFLIEEKRCDYLVTTTQKKTWLILLDMAEEIDRICKKHNIQYFWGFGSLLGVVRHKGFIPWDDDLDIVMKRDDYERFIKLSDEFKYPYFLQIPETDKGYFHTHAKLRNSETTGWNPITGYEGFNQGIWVDFFPLDNYINEDGESRFNEIKKLNIDEATQMRIHNPNLNESNLKRVKDLLSRDFDPLKTYYEVERIAKKYQYTETPLISAITVSVYKLKNVIYYAEDFSDKVTMKCEGLEIPVPIGYKRILETTYGNYMEFPPIEKRGIHHNEVFDPDTPYKLFIKRNNIII